MIFFRLVLDATRLIHHIPQRTVFEFSMRSNVADKRFPGADTESYLNLFSLEIRAQR